MFTQFSTIEDSLSELGNRIKEIRIASEMTQEDLAQKAGISYSSVHRLENGNSVQTDSLLRVLKALNLIQGLEAVLPKQEMSPVDMLTSVKKKKIYRKTAKTETVWKWGE